MRAVLTCVVLLATSSATVDAPVAYGGMCEASAIVFLDPTHFVVASDETNVLQVYTRGKARPDRSVDLRGFTGFNKSDFESAAVVGNRIYWMGSHSFSRRGWDEPQRKILVATEAAQTAGGVPTLKPIGAARFDLGAAITKAAGVDAAKLNIEGMAPAPDGGLLIGLRGPLAGARAIVITLSNPAEMIAGASPRFGPRFSLPLDGLGIRDIARVDAAKGDYLIAAGHSGPEAETVFALYWWSGRNDHVELKEMVGGLFAEGVARVPGTTKAMLISDDGELCSDKGPPSERRFRSRDVNL